MVEQLQAQSASHSHQVRQQITNRLCELQNSCCFISALQISYQYLSVSDSNWTHEGKGILGNVVHKSQVGTL